MMEKKPAPSFFEQFGESLNNSSEGTYFGCDSSGRYESRASLNRERDAEYILETRRYFYPDGRLKRISRILNENYGESFIRTEEWSEDGSRQYVTSYGGANEWLWEKSIDHKTGHEKLSVNRDSFIFFSFPEDAIRSLETGEFQPERLLEIRWEDTREAILEILGAARAVPGLPMQAIDRFGPNSLLRMEWRDRWGAPRMQHWCFLELHCSSTAKVSYLRVPQGFTDVLSAIAWTFGTDKENYLLDKET